MAEQANKTNLPKAETNNKDKYRITAEDHCGSHERDVAKVAMSPAVSNAQTVRHFAKGTFGELDLTESVAVMREKIEAVQNDKTQGVEAILTAQAVALDAIFGEMARRAALNMGHHLATTETYMRMALRAQNQCRATLETLATIKNPPVVFAKQANIAHGPQQVNNGTPVTVPLSPAREGKTIQTNELLMEANIHGETLDTRGTTTTGRSNQELETVEAVHRP